VEFENKAAAIERGKRLAMVDYAEWLQRAEAFVRRLNRLPGCWSMNIAVDPPLDVAEAERLDKALPHGLPRAIHDFYVSASASAECTYTWRPDGFHRGRLDEVLPDEGEVYGGIAICPAARLQREQEGFASFAKILPELGRHGPAAAEVVQGCVPLIAVDNGDCLALHVAANPRQPPVLYLIHDADVDDESPVVPISSSFEQFLGDWELLGYIGPDIWLLQPFLEDSKTGELDADSPLARRWRALIDDFR
jgi:hypothetical protein